MALTTLLGLVLPFGNIWGPFLVTAPDATARAYRKKLVIAGVVVTLLGLIISLAIGVPQWVAQIQLLEQGDTTISDGVINSLIAQIVISNGLILAVALGAAGYQLTSSPQISVAP